MPQGKFNKISRALNEAEQGDHPAVQVGPKLLVEIGVGETVVGQPLPEQCDEQVVPLAQEGDLYYIVSFEYPVRSDTISPSAFTVSVPIDGRDPFFISDL